MSFSVLWQHVFQVVVCVLGAVHFCFWALGPLLLNSVNSSIELCGFYFCTV